MYFYAYILLFIIKMVILCKPFLVLDQASASSTTSGGGSNCGLETAILSVFRHFSAKYGLNPVKLPKIMAENRPARFAR